jgi:hypothetical protein
MGFLGFWQTPSLCSAIVLLNWILAQRCQRSTNPPVEAFFWEPTTGTIVLIPEGHYLPVPSPICDVILPEPPSGAAFGSMGSNFILSFAKPFGTGRVPSP